MVKVAKNKLCLLRWVRAAVCWKWGRFCFRCCLEEPLPHGLWPTQPAAGVHGVWGTAIFPQPRGSEGPHWRGPPAHPNLGARRERANTGGLGWAGVPAGTLLQQPAAAAQQTCGRYSMSSDHVVKSPDTAELKVAAEEHLLASSVRLIPNEVYPLIGSYIHIM